MNSKSAAIFLNGTYPESQIEFYREAIAATKGKTFIVAADGGLNLFRRLGLAPDLAIGDFDSTTPETLAQFQDVETIRFPTDKDATDGELAVREILKRGYNKIEVYGTIDTDFETDQLIANLLLLKLIRDLSEDKTVVARAVDHRQHIYFVENESVGIQGKTEDNLSIIPLSEKLILSLTGTRWDLDRQVVKMGQTWTLRNQLEGTEVRISVEGSALVVHRWG